MQFGGLCQRTFLEKCVSNNTATCDALRKLREVLTAPATAAMAVISGSTSQQRATIRSKLQERWQKRHACARPSLLQRVKWISRSERNSPSPLLPLRHLVVG